MTIILLLIITGAFALIFIQSRKIKSLSEKIDSIPMPMPDIQISAEDAENPFATKTPNKRGIIKREVTRTRKDTGKILDEYRMIVEVEIVESLANNMSRIKIINVSGAGEADVIKYAKDSLPEIIETSKITFV